MKTMAFARQARGTFRRPGRAEMLDQQKGMRPENITPETIETDIGLHALELLQREEKALQDQIREELAFALSGRRPSPKWKEQKTADDVIQFAEKILGLREVAKTLAEILKEIEAERVRIPKKYITTSEELLSPDVGAMELGVFEANNYKEMAALMEQKAAQWGIYHPVLVVDVIHRPSLIATWGPGFPRVVTENEWRTLERDTQMLCDSKPKIYMVNGERFSFQI